MKCGKWRMGAAAVLLLAAWLTGNGCRSDAPEYYRELSETERAELEESARKLVLQAKVVPEHLSGVFAEIRGHERIVYTGDYRGKAEYRWEIYDNPSGTKVTQKDVNPFWVRVYAEGDLRDPSWRLSHSADWRNPEKEAASSNGSVRRPEARPAVRRSGDSVRYRR